MEGKPDVHAIKDASSLGLTIGIKSLWPNHRQVSTPNALKLIPNAKSNSITLILCISSWKEAHPASFASFNYDNT